MHLLLASLNVQHEVQYYESSSSSTNSNAMNEQVLNMN